VPTGTLIDFAGSAAPDGYLLCDGSAVSRTTYSALFAVIGTIYGTGDGSTTFTLPNLIDRFKQGSSTAGTYKSAGLPNIKGGANIGIYGAGGINLGGCNGAFSKGSNSNTYQVSILSTQSSVPSELGFNASTYNSIYSDSVSTVQPPALTVLPCIKY
jgi:hypothetical protein